MERASGEVALRIHVEELKHLRQILAKLDREIRVLAQAEEYKAQVLLLRTIPGLSTQHPDGHDFADRASGDQPVSFFG